MTVIKDSKAELNPNRHYYLYAKDWYKKTDVMKDLTKIHAKWCWLDDKDILPSYISGHLAELAWKHIKSAYDFNRFISLYHTENPLHIDQKAGYHKCTIYGALRILSTVKADEIDGDLGEPDPSILALRKCHESPPWKEKIK